MPAWPSWTPLGWSTGRILWPELDRNLSNSSLYYLLQVQPLLDKVFMPRQFWVDGWKGIRRLELCFLGLLSPLQMEYLYCFFSLPHSGVHIRREVHPKRILPQMSEPCANIREKSSKELFSLLLSHSALYSYIPVQCSSHILILFKKCVFHNCTIAETKYHITSGPNILPLKYLMEVIFREQSL